MEGERGRVVESKELHLIKCFITLTDPINQILKTFFRYASKGVILLSYPILFSVFCFLKSSMINEFSKYPLLGLLMDKFQIFLMIEKTNHR